MVFDHTAVSPPTRGWPDMYKSPAFLVTGFPAHAGMALAVPWKSAPPCWFPRPRGDGPYSWVKYATIKAVSPPTRGWPAGQSAPYAAASGFPAHAGMAPPSQ